jgi:hypothetical protein
VTPGQAGATTSVQFSVVDPAVREIQDLQVTVDTGALPAGVTVAPDEFPYGWDCTTSAASIVCSSTVTSSVEWGGYTTTGSVDSYLPLNVTVDPGASFATGSITATATATGLDGGSATAPYSVAQPVEMVGQPVGAVTGPPGQRFSEQWAVTNAGTATVHGVTLVMYGSDDIPLIGARYSNCHYPADSLSAYCTFDNDLAPGVTYTISAPQDYKIRLDHTAPWKDAVDGDWSTSAEAAYPPPDSVAGQGAPLSLVVQSTGAAAPPLSQAGLPQTDQNYRNDSDAGITVTGTNPADLEAVGGKASGVAVGQAATLQLGVRDDGPASAIMNRAGEEVTFATVTVPTGTTATAVPVICEPIVNGQPDDSLTGLPGFGTYDCSIFHTIELNQTYALPFTFTPTVAQDRWTGSITIDDAGNTADNTAQITLKP